MLNESGPASITLERFYEIATSAQRGDIDAALARFPASARIRNPVAIGLRAMKAVSDGDVPGAIALLKRAIAPCAPRERQYLLELLIPLLINTNRIDEAAEALAASDDSVPDLAPAFTASRAIVAARQGHDAASSRYAQEALETGRAVDNPMVVGRVLNRTALAAFYREDFDEAQDRALETARWYERLESHRNASLAYSILYIIANDWLGDPDVARFYARRVTMNAHLAGDLSMENLGLVAQLDIAAETGDVRRFRSLRARLLSRPLNEQYRERFSSMISEVLEMGWSGRFDAARVSLISLRNTTTLSLAERSLCDALLAIAALSTWHADLARRIARRTLSQTAERSSKEPLFDARRRRFARILSAAVCIVLGDTVRGRRALSRTVDPDQRFAALIDADGIDPGQVPPMLRGYVMYLNEACRAANRARPTHGLTEAELEVLRALPSGMTLASIALSLGKSRKTVERQVGSIYAKLQVANRAQAIQRARDLGV